MNTQKRTPCFWILALLVAGCFLISPTAKAGEPASESSQEIHQLLSQVRAEAITLERDSEELAAWTRAVRLSWTSHLEKLIKMKKHVNEAGQLLTRLNEARGTASPWQQQAIDRIYPLLKELADNTDRTINHLNANQTRIHFAPYIDYAKAGADLAQELATLVSDYVEFGEQEEAFQRLQEKLQPATS
jgi:hypothetical protein